MYGPGEEDIIKKVLEYTKKHPVVAPLVDIRTLAGIIKQCKLFICNDTGVLHISAGVGTSTLAIFGPSDPDYWNPVGEEHIAIRGKDCTTDSVSVEEVFFSFTYGGEALSLAAIVASINKLKRENVYEYVWKIGAELKKGVEELIAKHDLSEYLTIIGYHVRMNERTPIPVQPIDVDHYIYYIIKERCQKRDSISGCRGLHSG